MNRKENCLTGRSGRFNVAAPFDNIIKANIVYTIKTETFITELIREGIDVFSTVYKVANLDKDKYKADVAANVRIYTLLDHANKTTYIPEAYIIGSCIRDGVEYVEKTFIINIGAFPISKDIAKVISDTLTYIKSKTGVTAKGEVRDTSIVAMIPNSEDKALQAARIVVDPNNSITRIKELEALVVSKNKTIADLECVIKHYNIG